MTRLVAHVGRIAYNDFIARGRNPTEGSNMKYFLILFLLSTTAAAAADDLDAIVKTARDKKVNFDARFDAVGRLQELGTVEVLRGLLSDPAISWAAADALGEIGRDAEAAIPELAKLAAAVDESEVNSVIADQAMEAIGKIGVGTREALQAMATRMSKKRDGEAAFVLMKLGEPGVEELFRLAILYSDDKRPESERRFGEAYSIVRWGDPPFPRERIPLLEKYFKQKGTRGRLAGKALAAIGDPAKETVVSYLDSTDRELRVMAAESLSHMNWFAKRERTYRKATTPDPVPDDELFSKVAPLVSDASDELDWRLFHVLLAADVKRAMNVPVIAAMWKKDLERQLYEYAQRRQRKFTVYVYKKIKGQWIKQDDRTFIGDEMTARKYESDVNSFTPADQWLAKSNLEHWPTPDGR